MNFLDGIVLVLFVGLLVRGAFVGCVRQLAFVLALAFGYLLAGRYQGVVAPFLSSWIANAGLRFFVAYLIVFFVVYLAVMLLGVGLRKVLQVSFLSWFDRLVGGLLGGAKAVFLAVLLYMGLAVFLSGASPVFTESFTAPWLRRGAELLTTILQDRETRERLLPRPPAILSPGRRSSAPVEPPKAIRSNAAGVP